MIEVKVGSKVVSTPIAAPLGTRYYQRNNYPTLYIAESGQLLPDNIYYIKQGNRVEMCRVRSDGTVINADWVNSSLPLYLVT